MTPEVFSEFLTRQGYKVIRTESCYWYNAHPGFYFYFPYHKLISPTKDELKRILWSEPSVGVRFFSSMDSIGKDSYTIVSSNKNYDISSVDAKYARRQTRRGLEKFEIRSFSFRDLATRGNNLNYETLSRQKRSPQVWNEHKWQLYCDAADNLDGFEAWGAFSGKNLAAFMVTFQMEDHFTILHQSSAKEYLHFYPNNALVYFVTKLKIAQQNISTVSYGPQSLDAPQSLDKFKFRMGFEKRPMKQIIVFNPLIEPFVNGALHKFVQLLVHKRLQSETYRKVEGIIRFYRESS